MRSAGNSVATVAVVVALVAGVLTWGLCGSDVVDELLPGFGDDAADLVNDAIERWNDYADSSSSDLDDYSTSIMPKIKVK